MLGGASEMDLLHAWASWEETGPPYVLEADRPVLADDRSARHCVTFSSWAAAYTASEFGRPGDTRLHLGLLPQPFFGDLRRASIYVLLLNPGLGPTDYYGEYEVSPFRAALLATLRQRFDPGQLPFLFLDPKYSWHGGYDWWHGKLAAVIEALASGWSVTFGAARARLNGAMAAIELLPYHSSSFGGGRWLQRLPSVALAQAFVREVVIPRVERRDAIAIVTRQVDAWNLPDCTGVVRYSAQEARAAHLSPDSPGGQAIVAHARERLGA